MKDQSKDEVKNVSKKRSMLYSGAVTSKFYAGPTSPSTNTNFAICLPKQEARSLDFLHLDLVGIEKALIFQFP